MSTYPSDSMSSLLLCSIGKAEKKNLLFCEYRRNRNKTNPILNLKCSFIKKLEILTYQFRDECLHLHIVLSQSNFCSLCTSVDKCHTSYKAGQIACLCNSYLPIYRQDQIYKHNMATVPSEEKSGSTAPIS